MSVQVTRDEADGSRVYVRFIDILFAVVMGQSFVLLTSKYVAWFGDWASYMAQIATILLVYALVVTSWVGYHRSAKAYPILHPLRFLLDIFLLFMYYFAFASAGDFGLVMHIFVIVFIAYTLWDLMRLLEYWNRSRPGTKEREELTKRVGVSALFAAAFWLVSYLYSFVSTQPFATGAVLVCMIALLTIFRVVKRKYGTKVSFGRERCDHLAAHYFTAGGSPTNPIGDRILVNRRTNTAYHMRGDVDQLVSEQKIHSEKHYESGEAEWCLSKGLRLEKRPPNANELF